MTDTSVEYRYFITNIVTNQVIAEVPLTGVSYEKGLKDAGSFSGTLSLSVETDGLDVYNSTLPGKNAIYVLRNGRVGAGGEAGFSESINQILLRTSKCRVHMMYGNLMPKYW